MAQFRGSPSARRPQIPVMAQYPGAWTLVCQSASAADVDLEDDVWEAEAWYLGIVVIDSGQ